MIEKINFKSNNTSAVKNDVKLTPEIKKDEKKMSTEAKIAIALSSLAAVGLATFAILRKGKGAGAVREAAGNLKKDVLGYKVKPPKIDDIPKGVGLVHKYTPIRGTRGINPMEIEYARIMADIERSPETLKRYNEVISGLQDTAAQIRKKIKEICPKEGFDAPKPHLDRVIRQKRYFSMPGNIKKGYCGKDPLLYKAAREEAIDIMLGYRLLSPLQNGGRESKLLNGLRSKYNAISAKNNSFIDECIERLKPEDALCSGPDSKFHAYELARLGKIFREAMNIAVK